MEQKKKKKDAGCQIGDVELISCQSWDSIGTCVSWEKTPLALPRSLLCISHSSGLVAQGVSPWNTKKRCVTCRLRLFDTHGGPSFLSTLRVMSNHGSSWPSTPIPQAILFDLFLLTMLLFSYQYLLICFYWLWPCPIKRHVERVAHAEWIDFTWAGPFFF